MTSNRSSDPRRRPGVRALAGGALLAALLAFPPPAAPARAPVQVDDVWVHPQIQRHDVRSVAVFPAFTGGSYSPYHPLSDELTASFRHDGRRWVTPLSAWQGLGDSEPERLKRYRELSDEVRGSGRPRAAVLRPIAERLGVDALMLVRVDRWERVSDASDETTVEAATQLVEADGTVLWRASGRSRVSTPAYRPRGDLPKPSAGNKLLEVVVSGGGSDGGSSGGSGGGSPPVAGSAGGGSGSGSGSGGSGSGQQVSRPPQKLEAKVTPLEDLVRARDSGQPDLSKDAFQQAAEQLVGAWAAKRPASFRSGAAAAPDSAAARPASR